MKAQRPNNDYFARTKINNVFAGQPWWSMSSQACWCTTCRLVLLDRRHCSFRVKLTFPMVIFLDNNLGQDSYTMFLSALNWVPDQYTSTDHPDVNNYKSIHSCQLFFHAYPGMPQNCHSAGVRYSPIHICSPSVGTEKVAVCVIRYSSHCSWVC